MDLAIVIHMVGGLGVFPSRAFIPAFATAMLLRFGPQVESVRQTGLFAMVGQAPTWFTHDATLIVLGLLSVLEIVATKSVELRAFMLEFDQYLKGAMVFLVTVGVASAADAAVVERIREAGVGSALVALLAAGAVFSIAGVRNAVLAFLHEADDDDSLGLQKLISWLEDLWAPAGVLILFLLPFLMVFLALLILGGLYLLRKYLERREKASLAPCANCGGALSLLALNCPHCKAAVQAPHAVGFLGQARPESVKDREAHALALVEQKRCPVCATRFPARGVRQTCAACGHALMADSQFAERYLARIAGRMPRVLLTCFLLSLLPFIGLIPGVVYYRFALVAPFRRYLPFAAGCLTRWLVRLLAIGLVAIQWIPFLGGVTIPLIALLSYGVHRKAYVSGLR